MRRTGRCTHSRGTWRRRAPQPGGVPVAPLPRRGYDCRSGGAASCHTGADDGSAAGNSPGDASCDNDTGTNSGHGTCTATSSGVAPVHGAGRGVPGSRAGRSVPGSTRGARDRGAHRRCGPGISRASRSVRNARGREHGCAGPPGEEDRRRRVRDGGRGAVTRDSATPLMQQYREIKARHQSAILFFRMGDFYEMFYEDAEVASRALGLTLTSRNNGGAAEVPLAGVPVKAVSEYLRRLVQQGFRVAICEQVEDPRTAKGIVRREVVETITPGAAFADDLLDGRRNNFLCALHAAGGRVGVAAADLSTGEFRLAVTDAGADLDALLSRFAPREVLVPGNGPAAANRPRVDEALVTERDAWEFDPVLARDDLAEHFGVRSLDGFGLGEGGDEAAIGAAGALL